MRDGFGVKVVHKAMVPRRGRGAAALRRRQMCVGPRRPELCARALMRELAADWGGATWSIGRVRGGQDASA